MITRDRIRDVIGSTLYAAEGEKIGKVGQVYLDNNTKEPQFATVRTGMFGSRESFVPLDRADARDGEVRVPHEAQHIKDAPNIDTEKGKLSKQEEQRLYSHYGMDSPQRGTRAGDTRPGAPTSGSQGGTDTAAGAGAGTAAGAGTTGTTGTAAGSSDGTSTSGQSGRTASDRSGDEAMTRSVERLQVGKESREAGRARLRKYVVTENVEHTVPVSHDEVRVEREPITDENRETAEQGPAFTEAEHEETLYEEQPVVSKEEVPVERVRLTKETHTEQQQVSGEVRKEHIEEDIPSEQRSREEGESR